MRTGFLATLAVSVAWTAATAQEPVRPVVVDRNGRYLGELVEITDTGFTSQFVATRVAGVAGLMEVNPLLLEGGPSPFNSGTPMKCGACFFYAEPDCGGQPYGRAPIPPQRIPADWLLRGIDGTLYSFSTRETGAPALSYSDGDACWAWDYGYEVYPLWPVQTGFGSLYNPPFSIGFVDLASPRPPARLSRASR